MPYCAHCGKETLWTDRFCPNCGQSVAGSIGSSSPQGQVTISPQQSPTVAVGGPKSATLAALLNFFFPGAGYVYAGVGRDVGQVVFGILVFVFFFIGFEVGFAADIFASTASSSTASVSPSAALLLLTFLLPFAFAYDGYRRAKS